MSHITGLFLAAPQTGGVYSLFRVLRQSLADFDIELRWLSSGTNAMFHLEGDKSGDALSMGDIVAPHTSDLSERSAAMLAYIAAVRPSFVMCNLLTDVVDMNLMAYLPQQVLRFAIVHTTTPTTYRAARAIRPTVDATIAVSPRISRDLIEDCGFSPATTSLIPNGVDMSRFASIRRDTAERPARILFLGRVDDGSKGTQLIVPILSPLAASAADFKLVIAGDGPDLPRLRAAVHLAGLDSRTSFLGAVSPSEVPGVLAASDILLMPSRFEGLPLSLIEAMAAGCVPVVSHLHGVTDFVVTNGSTGILFPIGNVRAASAAVSRLATDGGLRSRMSTAARSAAFTNFNSSTVAVGYNRLLRSILSPRRSETRPFSQWQIDPGFSPGWWHFLPVPAKSYLRGLRERWAKPLSEQSLSLPPAHVD